MLLNRHSFTDKKLKQDIEKISKCHPDYSTPNQVFYQGMNDLYILKRRFQVINCDYDNYECSLLIAEFLSETSMFIETIKSTGIKIDLDITPFYSVLQTLHRLGSKNDSLIDNSDLINYFKARKEYFDFHRKVHSLSELILDTPLECDVIMLGFHPNSFNESIMEEYSEFIYEKLNREILNVPELISGAVSILMDDSETSENTSL